VIENNQQNKQIDYNQIPGYNNTLYNPNNNEQNNNQQTEVKKKKYFLNQAINSSIKQKNLSLHYIVFF
jgi:hypothetical protein